MSLAITYGQLRREVGRYLGFDRDPANWTTDEAQDVNDVIDSGLRQFYFPPRLPGDLAAHKWTFLLPQTTMTLVAGTDDYDLPAGFAGFDGDLFYESQSFAPYRVLIVNEARIMSLRSSDLDDINEWYPRYAAVVAKTSDETAVQVQQLQIWPKPDAAYVLRYQYHARPATDTVDANHPLGGAEHAEAIRASIIAAAESTLDDERGQKYGRFLDLLRGAVDYDLRSHNPRAIGKNLDSTTYSSSEEGYVRTTRLTTLEKYPL